MCGLSKDCAFFSERPVLTLLQQSSGVFGMLKNQADQSVGDFCL